MDADNLNNNISTDSPLVSVTVVAYNACDTVIETLESIFLQTYKNIELIISDDCSKDNTVDVCKDWISTHKDRFVRVVLLTANENQGIVRNCNRSCREAKGTWIKLIAADDKLFPNCIEDYVNYCKQNPEAEFVTSIQKVYDNTFDEENCINPNSICKDLSIFDKTANEQLRVMAYWVFVNAPTVFLKKSLYDRLGGYDECYAYEDHPFYIKVLEAGHKIYFMNKVTVGYRVHNSIFNSNERLFNYKFSRESLRFRKERCYKYYSLRQRIAISLCYKYLSLVEKIGLNKKMKGWTNIFMFVKKSILSIGKN